MSHRYEIGPIRHWKNKVTGRTASLYGAVPFTNDADRANWEIVDNGFGWHDHKTNTFHGTAGQSLSEVMERLFKFTSDFATPVLS